MKRCLIISLSLFFISCSFFSRTEKNRSPIDHQTKNISARYAEKEEEISAIAEKGNTALNKKNVDSILLDTVALKSFWGNFQNNLHNENRQKVIEVLDLPIHAIFLVLFRYAVDCDTLAYIENEKKYWNFDIDTNNIVQYYDFVFTEVLKKIINQTSVNDLLSKGYINDKIPGLTYIFFPKNYDVKVNCSNDHNLKFYITCKENRWLIGIGGL